MDFFAVLKLLGGVALFLFGMSYMGDSLKKLSGSSLETILKKLTSNRFKGFFLGLAVTAIIQSSSAVMVMLVGFVNSSIMQLSQTTSVLMGANIGTTVTAWILSTSGISGESFLLKILQPTSFTPVLVVIGVIMVMMSKSEKKKDVGAILIGFSVLMFGMETMSQATSGLKDSKAFTDALVMFSHPIMGIVVGTIFTAIIQSSSASVGILQALCLTSPIPMSTALPLILGMNIGAAVPPVISAVNGNVKAKQVAASCVSIKIIGVIVVASVFYLLNSIWGFGFMESDATVFTIALSHTTFNILSTIILMPFCKWIERLSERIFKDSSKYEENIFSSLDDRFFAFPSVAIEQSRELIVKMSEIAEQSVGSAIKLIHDFSAAEAEEIVLQEETVDKFDDKLSTYLVNLSGMKNASEESGEIAMLQHIIGDIERISDHACNILGNTREMNEKNIVFSGDAERELRVIESAIGEILSLSVEAIRTNDMETAMRIEPLEQVIDKLRNKIKSRHVARLHNDECTDDGGFVFLDLLSNFERVSDHCSNIAVYLLQQSSHTYESHYYLSHVKKENQNHFSRYFEEYQNKYSI